MTDFLTAMASPPVPAAMTAQTPARTHEPVDDQYLLKQVKQSSPESGAKKNLVEGSMAAMPVSPKKQVIPDPPKSDPFAGL